jgi:hypothetical protein
MWDVTSARAFIVSPTFTGVRSTWAITRHVVACAPTSLQRSFLWLSDAHLTVAAGKGIGRTQTFLRWITTPISLTFSPAVLSMDVSGSQVLCSSQWTQVPLRGAFVIGMPRSMLGSRLTAWLTYWSLPMPLPAGTHGVTGGLIVSTDIRLYEGENRLVRLDIWTCVY